MATRGRSVLVGCVVTRQGGSMVQLSAAEARGASWSCHFPEEPAAHAMDEIADEIVGLHATSPVSPYLSLLARCPGFGRTQLDERMWGEWSLVRFRAMRLTMFLMSRSVLEVAAAATRHLIEAMGDRWLRDSGLTQPQFDRWADAVDEALESGPLTVRELRAATGAAVEVPLSGIVGRMCDQARLVGGRPPRTWTSPMRRYHRWVDVIGDIDLSRWSDVAATRHLVLRYVRGYGPVTLDDIAWWTGLTRSRCRTALASLGDAIDEVAVTGWPGPLYRLRGPTPPRAVGVHVLPLLDPFVQGYRDRVRLLDPLRHGFVWDGGGNAAATVVDGGRIIGVWQLGDGPEVLYHLFDGGAGARLRVVEAALARAGELVCERPVDVAAVATMTPLRTGGGRSAAHPLDGRPHRAGSRTRS